MYCSHCGAQAVGNFCSQCGKALQAVIVEATIAWEHECQYELLLQVPAVREAIDYHARQSRKRMSGEQFLALCDKLVPCGVPLEVLASLVQPLYASWGVATGKQRTAAVAAPVGRVLLRLLCALAAGGHEIRHVQQARDGCLIESSIPSDIWSFEGDLVIAVRAQGQFTEVQAATKFKGQFFDWGKSNRCLNSLFGSLQTDPAVRRALAS